MSTAIAIRNEMDVMTLGSVLAKSGYFQDSRDAAQAVVKVLAGQELGISPIASMTGIFIVKQRVTLSANLIAAVIKRAKPRYDYRVRDFTDKVCTLEFFEDKESVGVSTFTAEDARKAGTQNMDKFPRNMLFARAISNGAKWYCAELFGGGPVYTPDELGATVDGETGDVIDVGPGTAAPHAPNPDTAPADPPTRSIPLQANAKPKITTLPPAAPKPLDRAAAIARIRHLMREYAAVANVPSPNLDKDLARLTDDQLIEVGKTEAKRLADVQAAITEGIAEGAAAIADPDVATPDVIDVAA